MDKLLTIENIELNEILLTSGEKIITNNSHKFAVYNKENNIFEMVEFKDLNKDIHFLINTFRE